MPANPTQGTKLTPSAQGPLASIQGILGAKVLYDVLTTRKVRMVDDFDARNFLEEPPSVPELPVGCEFDAALSLPPMESLDMTLKLPSGDPLLHFELPAYETVTDKQADVANITMNVVVQNENGKLALDELPETVKGLADTAAREAQYNSAQPYGRQAVQEADRHHRFQVNDKVAQAMRVQRGNQDRSRVSKEFHEWRYCIITSKDWTQITDRTDTYGVVYIGPDPVVNAEGHDSPPYYKWLQYDDLRTLFKILRRYKRYYTRCGGKRLWEAQGHASKREAIYDLCVNDQDFQYAVSDLAGTADFDFTSP